MNVQKQEKGFTIIEVVLVLAIAALIFLMIFVALPALQRGQRDTARKNEAGTIASAVNTYRSNKRGSLPTTKTALDDYLNDLNQITTVTLVTSVSGYAKPSEDGAIIVTNAKCGETTTGAGASAVTVPVASGTARQAAVVAFVENGGVYCQDA